MSESAVCGKVGTRADVGTGANSCDYGLWHPHLSLLLSPFLTSALTAPDDWDLLRRHPKIPLFFKERLCKLCWRMAWYLHLVHLASVQATCSADHTTRSDDHTMQWSNLQSWEWRRVLLLSSIISFVAAISIQNSLPSPSSMGITQSKAL